jgi:hypothetical protein
MGMPEDNFDDLNSRRNCRGYIRKIHLTLVSCRLYGKLASGSTRHSTSRWPSFHCSIISIVNEAN